MKAKLPLIGQIKTGEDASDIKEIQEIVASYVEKFTVSGSSFLGGVLDTTNNLSNEKTISTKLLEANKGWVYRNNDVIAKEVSKIQFELYRIDLKQGEIDYTEIDSHPILDLLDRFNDATTKSDGIYNTQSHKKLTGDAFWLLEGKGTNLINIYLLPPDKIELDLGDITRAGSPLIKGYKYKDTIDGKEIKEYYEPDEILHFKTPNPKNMFRGYGAVEAAAEDIDLDNLTTSVNRAFFENGAITNFVLSTDGNLTEDQVKRLNAQIKRVYKGAKNAYNTMILSGGLKPQNISMSNKDMEFLAQLEWYRDKIMVIFGNTKASLGIIDDVNRASHESSIISWKQNSVKAEMEALVNTINEFLVPRWGDKLVLGFGDPVPEDRDSKLNEITQTKGITSVNERRDLLGYDNVGPDGDKIPEITNDQRAEQFANSLNQNQDPNKTIDRAILNAPRSLQNVDLKSALRRYKVPELIAEYKTIKDQSRQIAKRLIAMKKNKTAKPIITQEHGQFSDDVIFRYWAKQIKVVEVLEPRFKHALIQFIDSIETKVLSNLEAEIHRRQKKSKEAISKALFNHSEEVVQAGIDLRPILIEQATIAGQQALALINQDDPYIPLHIRPLIDKNIKKFAGSMLDTQQEKMSSIIEDGIKEGLSVPAIRSQIEDAFDQLKKTQSERITRTEVLRVSNEASVDAWTQSGVVEGKQWLTAEDDRVDEECSSYNGKILELEGAFTKTSYGEVGEPPLHPNCRCVVLPIVENSKGYQPATISEKDVLQKKIAELESQVDKRTKAYKELKTQATDDKVYIKALEKHLGIDDEQRG